MLLNPPDLLARDIHVWRFSLLVAPPHDISEYIEDADQARADRFVFASDKDKFLRARYVTRKLLGHYLNTDPKSLHLCSNRHGKPLLPAHLGISFNLSHAGNRGLIAIGKGIEIGVDIEELRMPTDLRGLANSIFSAEELRALGGLPDSELRATFFTCWTRKEAYLKALGVGLTIEPSSVTVGVTPDRREIGVLGNAGSNFVEVASIAHEGNFCAALAAVGGYSTHRQFDFDHIAPPELEPLSILRRTPFGEGLQAQMPGEARQCLSLATGKHSGFRARLASDLNDATR